MATGAVSWNNNSTSTTTGLGHVICTNMIEDTNISADGSLIVATGIPATSNTAFTGYGFQRLDDQEDGDLDPFVWFFPFSGASFAQPRAGNIAAGSTTDFFSSTWFFTSASFYGWRRRGFPTGDTFAIFEGSFLVTYAGVAAIGANISTRDAVACTFSSTAVPVREPIWIISDNSIAAKCRKGTLRWVYWVMGGNATDTYDGKKWVQFSTAQTSVVVGPWDGVTVPLNQ